jgi:two-component sensor histidine kinase
MKFIAKTRVQEETLYVILWTIALLTPIVDLAVRTFITNNADFGWRDIFSLWIEYIPYLLIFAVHNLFIAPLLIYKKKRPQYFILSVGLVLAFVLVQCQSAKNDMPPQGPPPMEMRSGNATHGYSIKGDKNAIHNRMHEFGPPRPKNGMNPIKPQIRFDQIFIIKLIIILLLLGMNIGIKTYFKAIDEEKKLKDLQQRNLEQELTYLKYQINPHFFMNTLNNIHALVDIDPEKAKLTIVGFSKLMRHLLYDGTNKSISLKNEIDFLNQYIELMKLRFTDNITIEADMPTVVPDIEIPPLIFISFVENAFKHGVSYAQKSFIKIKMSVDDGYVKFSCANSRHDNPNTPDIYSGIGLSNVKKRLDLIYGENYSLDIDDETETYIVTLKIPVLNK